MLLHVAHASKNVHQRIMIQTVDTDVVVLAVAAAQGLKPADELWLAFGTGKSFDTEQPMKSQVDSGLRRHVLFLCFMH